MPRIFGVGQWMLCILVFTTYNISSYELFSGSDAHAKRRKGHKAKKKKNVSQSVRRCVNFSQTLGEDEASVDFTLENTCEKELRCTIEWKLICDDNSADEANPVIKRAQTLSSTESWESNASADSCESDWRISAVRWNCTPADSFSAD